MTPEHTALVARLERTDCHHCKDAAAAIRALAWELERLKDPPSDFVIKRTAAEIAKGVGKFPDLGMDVFVHEHDYNQAENSRRYLRAEVAALKATGNQCEEECDALRAEVERLRKDVADAGLPCYAWDSRCTQYAIQRDAARLALGRLIFVAETSGGTAGRDSELCRVIAEARAALADKPRFTDGRGNDVTHLVEGKP